MTLLLLPLPLPLPMHACDGNCRPQHSKNHIQMVRDGILPRIFAVLRSPMKSIKHKHYAAVILSEVCTAVDNHRQICEEGGLNAMVALVMHFSEEVRAFAALAVERLAENSALRRPLVEAGAVPPLVVMLSAPKLFSQKNAALALGALAQVQAPPAPQHQHARKSHHRRIRKIKSRLFSWAHWTLS